MRLLLLAVAVVLAALLFVFLYRAGAIQFNRPPESVYPITGIDVSHHQGQIDWGEVAASGAAFAFIKATEGRDFIDPLFAFNWHEARAAAIPVGAYHFFTFCSPGIAQAEHFLTVAPPTLDALAPVVDVEFAGNCKSWKDLNHVGSELADFVGRVEQGWGVRPILYVTAKSLDRVLGDDFAEYPLWVRSVFTKPNADRFSDWLLWQFSDNARIPGISGRVDLNALGSGRSLRDLRSLSST